MKAVTVGTVAYNERNIHDDTSSLLVSLEPLRKVDGSGTNTTPTTLMAACNNNTTTNVEEPVSTSPVAKKGGSSRKNQPVSTSPQNTTTTNSRPKIATTTLRNSQLWTYHTPIGLAPTALVKLNTPSPTTPSPQLQSDNYTPTQLHTALPPGPQSPSFSTPTTTTNKNTAFEWSNAENVYQTTDTVVCEEKWMVQTSSGNIKNNNNVSSGSRGNENDVSSSSFIKTREHVERAPPSLSAVATTTHGSPPSYHILKQVRQSAAEMSQYVHRMKSLNGNNSHNKKRGITGSSVAHSGVSQAVQHTDAKEGKSATPPPTATSSKRTSSSSAAVAKKYRSEMETERRRLLMKKEAALDQLRQQDRKDKKAREAAAAASRHIQELTILDPVLRAYVDNNNDEDEDAGNQIGDEINNNITPKKRNGSSTSATKQHTTTSVPRGDVLHKPPTRLQRKRDLVEAFTQQYPASTAHTTFNCPQLGYRSEIHRPELVEHSTYVGRDGGGATTSPTKEDRHQHQPRQDNSNIIRGGDSLSAASPPGSPVRGGGGDLTQSVSSQSPSDEGGGSVLYESGIRSSLASNDTEAGTFGLPPQQQQPPTPTSDEDAATDVDRWIKQMTNPDVTDPSLEGKEQSNINTTTQPPTGQDYLATLLHAHSRRVASNFTRHHQVEDSHVKEVKLRSIASRSGYGASSSATSQSRPFSPDQEEEDSSIFQELSRTTTLPSVEAATAALTTASSTPPTGPLKLVRSMKRIEDDEVVRPSTAQHKLSVTSMCTVTGRHQTPPRRKKSTNNTKHLSPPKIISLDKKAVLSPIALEKLQAERRRSSVARQQLGDLLRDFDFSENDEENEKQMIQRTSSSTSGAFVRRVASGQSATSSFYHRSNSRGHMVRGGAGGIGGGGDGSVSRQRSVSKVTILSSHHTPQADQRKSQVSSPATSPPPPFRLSDYFTKRN